MKELIDLSKDISIFFPQGMRIENFVVSVDGAAVASGGIAVYQVTGKTIWPFRVRHLLKISTNLFEHNFVPFFTVKILEKHPLIWEFTSPHVYIEIPGFAIKSIEFQKLFSERIFDLYRGWSNFSDLFRNSHLRNASGALTGLVPEEVLLEIKEICLPFELEVYAKGYECARETTCKLLMFTNDIIAKDEINLGQPYLIGKELE